MCVCVSLCVGVCLCPTASTPPPLLPSTVDCYSGYRQVRTPFVWRDVGTNTSVLADFHPGGYGGITGGIDPATHMPYYDRDGTLCGCVGWPGLSDVMCYGWRGDNYGPAGDNETQVDFKLWGAAFPNAHVLASSPDTFFDKLQPFADELPVVTSEIGDTWMYGTASDPFKLAAMRSMMRHFAACETAGNCTVDKEPGIAAFKLAVQKLPEHTWGGCGCEHLKVCACGGRECRPPSCHPPLCRQCTDFGAHHRMDGGRPRGRHPRRPRPVL